jgi:hypothetical protein
MPAHTRRNAGSITFSKKKTQAATCIRACTNRIVGSVTFSKKKNSGGHMYSCLYQPDCGKWPKSQSDANKHHQGKIQKKKFRVNFRGIMAIIFAYAHHDGKKKKISRIRFSQISRFSKPFRGFQNHFNINDTILIFSQEEEARERLFSY